MASDERRGQTRLAPGLVGCLLAQAMLVAPLHAADEDAPDLELLIYLGSWPAGDDEWVAVIEWDGKIDTEAPTEPAPGEENDDE